MENQCFDWNNWESFVCAFCVIPKWIKFTFVYLLFEWILVKFYLFFLKSNEKKTSSNFLNWQGNKCHHSTNSFFFVHIYMQKLVYSSYWYQTKDLMSEQTGFCQFNRKYHCYKMKTKNHILSITEVHIWLCSMHIMHWCISNAYNASYIYLLNIEIWLSLLKYKSMMISYRWRSIYASIPYPLPTTFD